MTVGLRREHGAADRKDQVEPEWEILRPGQQCESEPHQAELPIAERIPQRYEIEACDSQEGHNGSAGDQRRRADQRIAKKVALQCLHIAKLQPSIGQHLRDQ